MFGIQIPFCLAVESSFNTILMTFNPYIVNDLQFHFYHFNLPFQFRDNLF